MGEISRELNVDYVVEGSLRKSSDRIRITVQLVEAKSGNQVWSKRFDSELKEIFELEEELSRTVAATVTGRIESDLQKISISKNAGDLKAYDLLLQGVYHGIKFTAKDSNIALQKLYQCLDHDPENYRALAYLGYFHTMNWLERWSTDYRKSFDLAGEHVKKAFGLAPDNDLVQTAYTEYMIFSGEYETARVTVNKALKKNPSNPEAFGQKALLLNMTGEYQRALESAHKCMEMDPHHHWGHWQLVESLLNSGKYEEAIKTAGESNTSPPYLLALIALCQMSLGQVDSAKATIKQFLAETRISMKSFPQSRDEWRSYWRDNMPYKDMGLNDAQFTLLEQAGICNKITGSTNVQTLPAVVVLPFDNLSGDPEQEYFSDGITDSIILNLSLFSGMVVKSRHSSFAYKESSKPTDFIAEELDIQYAVEGSIRKTGKTVRINVQLIEATSGNQLWGKRYDADLEKLFELEQELTQAIAGTISGQITHDIKQTALRKPAKDLETYDLFMRGMYHLEKFTLDDLHIARDLYNQCLERDPDNAEVHTLLGAMYRTMFGENWTTDRTQTLELANVHALRAVELDPQNDFIQAFTAENFCYLKKFDLAEQHANYAIEINPTHPYSYSIKAWAKSATGRYEDALKCIEISMQLDPHHPYTGWLAGEVYRTAGKYESAIKAFRTVPHLPASLYAQIAACYAGLDQLDKAKTEMEKFHTLARKEMPVYPSTEQEWKSTWYEIMPYESDKDSERFFELLLKAGLIELSVNGFDINNLSAYPTIAVLPFKNLSNDPEQEYFSDGISESIIQGLSMYKGLIVKSSASSFAFRDKNESIQDIAEQLQIQYIVDGSVRKAGNKIRLSAQLIDTSTGNQLWGKHYDAEPEDILNLEQELSEILVSTLRGRIDLDIQQTAIRKPANSLQSYDYYLKGMYHVQEFTPEDNRKGQEYLNKCLELDPNNANAHAYLAAVYFVEINENWTLKDRKQAIDIAGAHMTQALKLEPENAFVHGFMAEYLFFAREFEKGEFHAEKAMELNPTLPDGYAMKSWALSSTRRQDEAIVYADQCLRLDPHHPYAGWIIGETYRDIGDYDRAINTFRSLPHMPPSCQIQIAICFAGEGKFEQAKTEIKQFLKTAREQMPNFPQSEEEWRSFLYDIMTYKHDEDFEKTFDLALKAGLCDFIEEPFDTSNLAKYPAIAILPFTNLSGDPEQEYFSDGISESIAQGLSMYSGLITKSTHTSFAYRNSEESIGEIAEQLQVEYIVDGSVRKFGNRFRIVAQLIETSTGNQIWGQNYDSVLKDIIELEQELSQTITGNIRGRVEHDVTQSAQRKPTSDLNSFDYFLQASHLISKFTPNDLVRARELHKKAIEIDPQNAAALSGLGITYIMEFVENWTPDRKSTLSKAKSPIERSLELEPDNALIHTIMAEFFLLSREFTRGEFHADRAIELNPTLPEGYYIKSWACASTRRFEEAVKFADKCIQLDPHHPYTGWAAAGSYADNGDYELAIKTYRSIPNTAAGVHCYIANCLVALGRIDEARSEMAEFKKLARQNMPNLPATEEDWRSYWYDVMNYQFDEDFEKEFAFALEAGLCDQPVELDVSNLSAFPTIAVLPFKNLSNDPEQQYFSDGISQGIIQGLGMYKGLIVKSSQSSFAFRDSSDAIQEIAEQLQVKYVVDGSVRKVGSKIRLAAQLIESSTGNQLWGKHYDSELEDVLGLEQELSEIIVATLFRLIDQSIQQTAIRKPANTLESYDLILRAIHHNVKFTLEDHKEAQKLLLKCIKMDPNNADAHSYLAGNAYVALDEGWAEDRRDTLELARRHIERALELEPDNAFIHSMMAEYQIFIRDFERAEFHANKSMELNPTMPDGYAMKAWVLSCTRRFEESLDFSKKSQQLDPHHPYAGWVVGEAYRNSGEHEKAIETFRSLPHLPSSVLCQIAVCLAGAGKIEQAKTEMGKFREIAKHSMHQLPNSDKAWRDYFLNSLAILEHQEDADKLLELALKAGLCDYQEDETDEFPSIAVLPFENLSGDSEQEFFATGITNDIINILSKFRYLRIVSGYSTALYKDRTKPINEIAKEQDVRYVLDGGIRKSGNKIRVNVQLIDSITNENAWSEQFDRQLDDIFAIQDEITMKVASAMKVKLLAGERSVKYMEGSNNIKAWEYCVLAADLADTYVRENITEANTLAKNAIEIQSDNPDAWTIIGWCHWQEAYTGWSNDFEKSLDEAEAAVKTSLELDPEHWDGLALMSFVHILRDKPELAVELGNRAAEIAPGNFDTVAQSGYPLNYAGRHEEAIVAYEKALRLCASHVFPNWARVVGGYAYQMTGQTTKAIQTYQLGIDFEPDSPLCHYYLMDLLLETGKIKEAEKIAEEIRAASNPMGIKAMVQSVSHDPNERERFRGNMEKMGFFEEVKELNDSDDSIPSIAVLPFQNLSGDPEQQYFSNGITNDIVTTLSRFRRMRVVSNHSTAIYADRNASIEQISEEQGVRYILDGSVRKSGNNIRANVQLIDSHTGQNCWVEQYDRKLDDIFAVQDDITSKITLAMRDQLIDGTSAIDWARGTTNIKAWETCAVAADLQDSYIRANNLEAQRLAEKALEMDPAFSVAWIIKGWVHWQDAYTGWGDSYEASTRLCHEAADKALSIDPEHPEANSLKGSAFVLSAEPELAVEACKKAVAISPGNAETQALLAMTYNYACDYQKVFPHFEKALQLCPVSPNWFFLPGAHAYYETGNTEKAIELLRKGISVEPESPLVRYYLMDILIESGNQKEAKKMAKEIKAMDSEFGVFGLIQHYSSDKHKRDRHRKNLAKMGFME